MPAIKSMDKISEKWARASAAATPEYEEGVRNPRVDWKNATTAAVNAYNAGIQKSVSEKRFEKGVARAGTSKWQQGAISKGVSRWAPGIAVSQSAYTEGFKPYHDVIARTQLPARGAKGDPANINRVGAIAKALHDEKVKRA